jgi:hypothetical protein
LNDDRDETRAEGYEPPQVEHVPAEDGPAITAAGKSQKGPEWRPTGDVDKEPQ